MSKSGITRRIDELGRLVIPKEIRKNLKIKNNDQIEISIVNNQIVLSKYDVLKKDDIIHLLLLSLKKVLNKNVLFTSRDKIVDYSLLNKHELNDLTLNNDIASIIEQRKEVIDNYQYFINKSLKMLYYCISPLIINGDLYGSLIIYDDNNKINDRDIHTLRFVKIFLENYLE